MEKEKLDARYTEKVHFFDKKSANFYSEMRLMPIFPVK
jgi:hypothetical protein